MASWDGTQRHGTQRRAISRNGDAPQLQQRIEVEQKALAEKVRGENL